MAETTFRFLRAVSGDRLRSRIFSRGSVNGTQRQKKLQQFCPAAAPMGPKMRDPIIKRSRPQFGTWRDFITTYDIHHPRPQQTAACSAIR